MSTVRMAAVAAELRPRPGGGLRHGRGLIEQARAAGRRAARAARGVPRRLPAQPRRRRRARRPARPRSPLDGPEIAPARRARRRHGGDRRVLRGRRADRYNSAVCVTGDGVLGNHRKVHQPLGEDDSYAAGDRFARLRHPGRPARHDDLLRQGVPRVGAGARPRRRARSSSASSAWPGARTNPAPDLAEDRWTRRFDLFDRARALENQMVWLSANQSGTFGSLRFVASAKVVDPGGEILADTGVGRGHGDRRLDVRRRWRPPGGRWATCGTGGPRPTTSSTPRRRVGRGERPPDPDRGRGGPLRPRPRVRPAPGSPS